MLLFVWFWIMGIVAAGTTVLAVYVGHGRFEPLLLDIMFVAIETSVSLTVRAMRACAQERIQGHCLQAGCLRGVRAPQGSGGFGVAPNLQL